MSIRLTCPGCRKQLAVPDATAGQMGRCPVCNTLFNVPASIQPAPTRASAPPPPRRMAVAQPIPQPVLGEDAPATGLTVVQKIGFAVVAAGVLAVVGYFVHRSTSGDGAARDDGRQAVADATGKAPPARKDAEPKQPTPATTPSVPEPKPPTQILPLDPVPMPGGNVPEEDVGTKVDRTHPPVKPSPELPRPKPPLATEAPPKPSGDPAPRRDPPKPEPGATKPPAKESGPAETRPTLPADTYRPSGAGIYERLLKSTVMVLRKDETGTRASRGTGSLVHREQRLVLTNYHVVGDASEVSVTFPVYEDGKLIVASEAYRERFGKDEFLKAKVVRVLKEKDVALVQLDKLPAGVPALRLAPRSARPGDVVHSIGNPGASDAAWLYAKGEVRQVSPKTWEAKGGDGRVLSFDAVVLETTSPTNPGDSGGPLVNDFNQLVGVTQGANTTARGVSLFIDQSEVRKLLKEHGIEDEGGPDTARPENPAAEEVAKGLGSADAKTRAQAAARLADMGADAKVALHELIRLLEDPDRNVRKQAGNALAQLGALERGDVRRSDVGYLRACLRDESATAELQRWVMKVFVLLGADAKPAVPELGRLVKSEDKETRLAALVTLEKLGPVPDSILADAAAALKSDDRMQNGRLAMALVKLDPELKTDGGKAAVAVLVLLQKPKAVADLENKELLALVADAIKALTNLGKPAVPMIRKAMTTEYKGGNRTTGEDFANAAVRLALVQVVEAMGPKVYSAELDRDLLALETRDPVVGVREAAKQARAKVRAK